MNEETEALERGVASRITRKTQKGCGKLWLGFFSQKAQKAQKDMGKLIFSQKAQKPQNLLSTFHYSQL